MSKISTEDINQLLPQTQCQLCSFTGCLPYAEAISKGEAEPHLCQPGGHEVYKNIQSVLNRPLKDEALNTINTYPSQSHVVNIDLDKCIGCTKCLPACPVDAIVGSPKTAHYIIEDICTGCNLCIPTCPVDCITESTHSPLPDKDFLLSQHKRKQSRQQQQQTTKFEKLSAAINNIDNQSNDLIADAIKRARQKRLHHEQR
ncbi:MAG: RnfABCDGE type electron transport complex subunit B [Pseudomonadota bacterium]|nr:RnfABCDGE type electron transport complex subunit B [Pseudomonadota bacterium]